MKLPSIAIIACSLLALPVAELRADQSVQQLLTEAQKAYMSGDIETAKRYFQMVNRADPRNVTAIGFLRRIAVEGKKGGGNTMEKQLASVIIPKVEFREATLGSVLEYLKQTLEKTTGGQASVSFIVLRDVPVTQQVTLSVTNIPFTEVLRYIGGLADVQFAYEKYGVVVKSKNAGASAAVAPAPVTQ